MADHCFDNTMTSPVVSIAKEWIGTPYVHQASCKGTGTDCLGLLRGVWRELIGPEQEKPGAYSPDWAEAASGEKMLQGLERHLKQITPASASAGDVLTFRMLERGSAKHLAILSSQDIAPPDAMMIHAYSGLSVCETRLSYPWYRRIARVYRMPVLQT